MTPPGRALRGRGGAWLTWLLAMAVLVLATLALSRGLAGWSAAPWAWAVDGHEFQARIDLSAMDGLGRLVLAAAALLAGLLVLALVLPLGLLVGLAGLLLLAVLLGGTVAAVVGLPLLVVALVAALLLAPLLLLAWPLLLLLRWLIR